MAKVSMLIISYNEKEYLPRAIESCVNQTFKDKEIIVGDDGSSDDTLEYLEKLGGGYKILCNAA